ncbi:peptide/nickel transport system substrate-binding protein [Amycolatopsis bartoniae]|uniref:ABC transporter substrate-binding protein n=1 Tax=Amycolatopsis bartoniae TaxID=941986 RepID=A0A8H9IUV4_9PSEU|nr:ABC transporter substrate-binding protein [Amycolatopsis bartoniae]MBB2939878.1 peptide/nickel transport system substrate-binding protein [Amycolatopsis bartoniae]TVT08333.1 ABC transporter substrate-binding protein [Amycolatopsis bartoniae]GHF35931.1 ABC transporter substrate-binding protein [Amycolatopsis bartoniae]
MAAIVALTLSACAGVTGGQGPGRLEPDPNATIRWAISVPPIQMDPMVAKAELTHITYDTLIFDGLTTVDSNGHISPRLAESWAEAPDRASWTVTLRRGAVFHDGNPIDAQSVAANLNRALQLRDSTPVLANKLSGWSKAEVVDGRTVRILLNTPDPAVPAKLASPNLLIGSPAAFGTMGTQPVGSGPYRFVSRTADRVTYERFDRYWDPGVAKAARVEVLAIPDGAARMNALRAGQIDGTLAQVNLHADIASFRGDPTVQVLEKPTQSVAAIFLNTSRAPLDAVEVRRALNYAVDRQSLSTNLLGGLCRPTSQPFPDGPGHVAGLDDAYPHDPARARQLLSQARRDGAGIDAIFYQAGLSGALAPALQAQLAEAGIDLRLTAMNPNDSRPTFRSGRVPALVEQILPDADPSLTVQSFLRLDNPGGPSAEMSALGQAVLDAPIGTAQQEQALEAFNSYLVENPVGVPICAIPNFFVASNRVTGLADMPWSTVSGNTDIRGLGKA